LKKEIRNFAVFSSAILVFANVAIAKDDFNPPKIEEKKVPYIALDDENKKPSDDIDLMQKIKNAVNNLAFSDEEKEKLKEKSAKKEELIKPVKSKKDSSAEPKTVVKKDDSVKEENIIDNAASQLEELDGIDIENEQVELPKKKESLDKAREIIVEAPKEEIKETQNELITTRPIEQVPEKEPIVEDVKEPVIVEIDEENEEPVIKPEVPVVGVLEEEKISDEVDVTLEDMKKGFSTKSFDDLGAEVEKDEDKLSSLLRGKKETSALPQKSNAAVFDISGIMLRMDLLQVEEILKKLSYKKVMQKMEIPNFVKWRNEEKCRNNGVVGYERLASCVVQMSKAEKQQYIEVAKYQRFETKEEIIVNLTSNFTKNKIYKVTYKSMIPAIRGNSNKSQYLRNIKIHEFWRRINQKYGSPDNKQDVTWGLGGNKPYMKAGTGFLMLEDPMLKELDFTRMSREDQKYMNTDLYSF